MSVHDSRGSGGPPPPASTAITSGGGGGGRERRPTSGLAIATLILGLLGFLVITIPITLIVGVIALGRTAATRQRGKALALAGITLSLLWAGGIGLAFSAWRDSGEPTRDARGQIAKPEQARPDALKVGDCVGEITDGEIADVPATPCNQPNAGRVFAIVSLPKGPWPGEAAMDSRAGDACTKKYDARQQESKESEISFLRPTDVRWRLGDRKVICLVGPASSGASSGAKP
jgi:hypothetical protein